MASPDETVKELLKNGKFPENPIRKQYISETKAIDEQKLMIDFVISTQAIDRYGDTVDPTGWDLKNYKKNPVVLFAHCNDDPPIGRAIPASVKVDGKNLVATTEFIPQDIYPFSYMIFQLYSRGFMKATSVGFMPKEWTFVEDTNRPFGIDYKRQELLEFSCVPVPANPEALVSAKSAGIDVKPLRQWAEKILDTWKEDNGLLVPKKTVEGIYKDSVTPSKPKKLSGAEKDALAFRNKELIEMQEAGQEALENHNHLKNAISDSTFTINEDGHVNLLKEDKSGTKTGAKTILLYKDDEQACSKLTGTSLKDAQTVLIDAVLAAEDLDLKGYLLEEYENKEGEVFYKSPVVYMIKGETPNWTVGASRSLAIDEQGSWDGAAAKSRMFDDAGFGGDNPSSAKAKTGFLVYDSANPLLKGSYKLPFADIIGGSKKAMASGIRAAASRLPQTDIPDSVKESARTVIDAYEAKMKKDVTSEVEKDLDENQDVTEQDSTTNIATLEVGVEVKVTEAPTEFEGLMDKFIELSDQIFDVIEKDVSVVNKTRKTKRLSVQALDTIKELMNLLDIDKKMVINDTKSDVEVITKEVNAPDEIEFDDSFFETKSDSSEEEYFTAEEAAQILEDALKAMKVGIASDAKSNIQKLTGKID